MPDSPITNFKDSDGVDLGKKLVTKDYLLEVYGTILENSPASGLVVTPELWGSGRNQYGQLGINNTDPSGIPVTTFAGGTNWKQLSCGKNHTAAIKTDGSLWIWGRNFLGALGNNLSGGGTESQNRSTPITTFAGGNDWKQVACGEYHTSAIKTDCSLWSWGHNQFGMLGINNTDQKNTPVTTILGGTNWKSVACGDIHVLAIKTDGSLWVWGRGADGQLGTNNTADRSIPVTTFIGGNDWKSIAGGVQHSAAVKTDGSLWTWGTNDFAHLGINDTTQRNTPVTTFAGGNTWKSVACGRSHTIALKTDGTLWTWGRGEDGRLGNFATTNRSTPVTTFAGGNNWKSVGGGGDNHTAAIKTDGSLWVWGQNFYGVLGTNDSTTRSTPVTTFAGGNNWKQVSCGNIHTAAIQTIDYI